MFQKFINSLKRPNNISLIEAIHQGYQTIFENNNADLITEAQKYKTADEFLNSLSLVKHGTMAEKDFNRFKVSMPRDGFPSGIHFTTRDNVGYGKRVIEAHVDIKNPLIVNHRDDSWMVKNKFSGEMVPKALPTAEDAISDGHDGIIIKWKDGSEQHIAFSPDQVKTKQQLIDIWNKANNNK